MFNISAVDIVSLSRLTGAKQWATLKLKITKLRKVLQLPRRKEISGYVILKWKKTKFKKAIQSLRKKKGQVRFWFSSQEENEGSCFLPLADYFEVKRKNFEGEYVTKCI
ncbi:unnamed protein product [Arabidopsis thaliana]|uniref:Uncharacterized protein n=1 Tax=Arabidopsis thaliana TaxID=3702 RepID=A0A654FCR7_ARATH|nr:unnamed protein product [Arabidopsis thaliana]